MTAPIDDQVARSLIDRIARRDEVALKELHRLMARRIYAFAFHRSGDADQAETVVVDTMWEVWKSAERFRGDSQVSTWVFGIARFKTMEQRRQGPRDHDDIDEMADELLSDADDGEQALDKWQQRQHVLGCLKKLSAAHRECMQLVHYEGMGLSEVAEVQGVPENTIKTRMFHARKYLKACLEIALG
jgi:RNA polymerase sigma-70 factor (ECF subfamily)